MDVGAGSTLEQGPVDRGGRRSSDLQRKNYLAELGLRVIEAKHQTHCFHVFRAIPLLEQEIPRQEV